MPPRLGGHRLERGPEAPEGLPSERPGHGPTGGGRDHAKRVGVAGRPMTHVASTGPRARTPGGPPRGGARLPHVMTGDERSALPARVDACRPAGGRAAYRRPA